MNLRPSGYEPDELPGCSTPRRGRTAEDSRGLFPVVLVFREEEGCGREAGRAYPSSVMCRPSSDDRRLQAWRRPTLPCLETEYHWRLRRLTAEFGMGSGLFALLKATRPASDGFGGRKSENGSQKTEVRRRKGSRAVGAAFLSSAVSGPGRPDEAKLVFGSRRTDVREGKTEDGRGFLPISDFRLLTSAPHAPWQMRAIKSIERLGPVS